MNTRRIRKLQTKFTTVASLTFFIVMLAMGGIMYVSNLVMTRSEIHKVLDYIVENDGDISWDVKYLGEKDRGQAEPSSDAAVEENETDFLKQLKKIFGVKSWLRDSGEFYYSVRFFAVLYDQDMNLETVKTNHIATVDTSEAERYARIALNQFWHFGSYGDYYYKVADRDDGGKIVVYLESTRQINATNHLLYTALMLIGIGSIAAIFLMKFFAKWIMAKEVQNNELQNRFVTNASHELKTPLAVIKANTEVEQMLNGENEWNQSTLRQIERMTGLIQNLIRIVRAEEKEDDTPIQKLDVVPVVQETVDTFQTIASQEQKELAFEAPSLPMSCWMRETDMRQLVSLLVDNAIKYCDDQGKIEVALQQKGRNLILSVSNAFAEGEGVDYSRFFERFYREDESHCAGEDTKGGYGIGLSIAENLMERYKGKIDVDWQEGVISFRCTFHRNKKMGIKK